MSFVVGQSLIINEEPFTVIGVAPSGFTGISNGSSLEVWVPLTKFRSAGELRNRRGTFFRLIGRLKAGVMISQAGGPMGPQKAVSFQGYDPNEKAYSYHEFSSSGEAVEAKGTVEGNTWHWTSESKIGDTRSARVTIKEISKTEYTFKLEISQSGESFRLSRKRQVAK